MREHARPESIPGVKLYGEDGDRRLVSLNVEIRGDPATHALWVHIESNYKDISEDFLLSPAQARRIADALHLEAEKAE